MPDGDKTMLDRLLLHAVQSLILYFVYAYREAYLVAQTKKIKTTKDSGEISFYKAISFKSKLLQ